ncbi:MAG: peptidyl-tRNA hydrolase Pth2 [Candidatus Micrarchaeota archaeon]|nr:peptidyl-tRNA hydrolase Pth2 [Candidatus Micrarchaeota archaeon]
MKQVIVFRSDLKIGKGKIAAHAAHAGITGFLNVENKNKKITSEWLNSGQKKIVLKVGSEHELIQLYEKIKNTIPCQLIRDAGLTQVEPGTIICMVIGPWYDEEIDKHIKDLKLL